MPVTTSSSSDQSPTGTVRMHRLRPTINKAFSVSLCCFLLFFLLSPSAYVIFIFFYWGVLLFSSARSSLSTMQFPLVHA